MHDPRQLVYTLDHNVQDVSARNLDKYAGIAAFASRHGVDAYPAGRGIGHQVMVEEARRKFRGTPDCNESAALHSYGPESHCC